MMVYYTQYYMFLGAWSRVVVKALRYYSGGPGIDDLMDFLKQTKRKMYQRSNCRECVANYLTVIDMEG